MRLILTIFLGFTFSYLFGQDGSYLSVETRELTDDIELTEADLAIQRQLIKLPPKESIEDLKTKIAGANQTESKFSTEGTSKVFWI